MWLLIYELQISRTIIHAKDRPTLSARRAHHDKDCNSNSGASYELDDAHCLNPLRVVAREWFATSRVASNCPFDAAEAEMAGRGVDRLSMTRRRPVATTIIWSA
jgi:hypothetical protein